jgi:hypothetical protein
LVVVQVVNRKLPCFGAAQKGALNLSWILDIFKGDNFPRLEAMLCLLLYSNGFWNLWVQLEWLIFTFFSYFKDLFPNFTKFFLTLTHTTLFNALR